MQVLLAPTEDSVLSESTEFSAEEAVAQTQLSVKNAQGFSEDDYVILGRLGHEKAELRQVASVASDLTSITISSATKFVHEEGEPITKIFYNQRKFYRASSETGTYSHLSSESSPKEIEVDKPEGTFLEDTGGSSTSWYKATYYNSTTSIETSTDDAIAVQAGESDHYTSIYAIKRRSGFEDAEGISSELVGDFRVEAENEFESRIAVAYSLPLSSKPKLARQIVEYLAAGNLLIKEYGVEANIEISKSGARMLERANSLLNRIVDGTLQLIGEDGNVISSLSKLQVSGSNVWGETNVSRGEMMTLEDEHFRPASPDTGRGSTS